MKTCLIVTTMLLLALGNLTTASAVELTISGNGEGSQNEITTASQTTTTVEQNNQIQINNDIQASADTGNNEVSGNGGDASISTGDIDTKTTVETSANISAVNNECCPNQETTVTISGNGANTQNNINIDSTNQTNISTNQTANINNEIEGQANTGGNQANDDNGNISIDTGDIQASSDIQNHDINITDITVGQEGISASVKISGNGEGSINIANITQTDEKIISINNETNIINIIEWDLSTGNNFANGNLGDVAIFTGNIDFNLNIENGPINLSEVTISCCVTPTPSSTPSPTPTPSASPTPTPTSTPAPTPEGGGGGGESSGGGTAAAAAAGPGGEVLGVSAVGEVLAEAGNNWLILLTLLGLLPLIYGLYLRFGPTPEIEIKRLRCTAAY